MEIIRSTKLTIKYTNTGKQNNLKLFITEYRRIIKIVITDIQNVRPLPKYLDYTPYVELTWLSARVLRRLTDHAIQITKSIRKNKKSKNKKQNKQPNLNNINPSLDKNHYNIQKGKHFDEILSLRCLGNKLKINIPLKHHKQFNNWNNRGIRMGGIEINEKWIKINFEIQPTEQTTGSTIGIDQGINKTITTSDNQSLPKTCKHGHTLSSILDKLCRKKKKSQAFKRAQEHRKNYINWTINQLNLSGVKEIRLEKIDNFFYRKHRSRKTNRWAYSLIRDKVLSFAHEHGVRVLEQSAQYRSQRCSSCGLVRKSNRKGELYHCSYCGVRVDSDLNAARNHVVDLPEVGFRSDSISGFFWNPVGSDGGCVQSPFQLS